jgi:hypothetical protein
VDSLVRDDAHQVAVVIESKVDVSEHSDQLQRNQDAVMHQYPGWRIVSLLLTPEGYCDNLERLRGRELLDGVQPGRRTRGEPRTVAQ